MKSRPKPASTMISALTARTQLGQILERVKTKNERFIITRRGKPQAILMSIEDYMDVVAPAPDWLKSAWAASRKNGTDKLTMREIDREIAKVRGAKARSKTKKAARVKVGSELAKFGKTLGGELNIVRDPRPTETAAFSSAFEAVWSNPEDDAYDSI